MVSEVYISGPMVAWLHYFGAVIRQNTQRHTKDGALLMMTKEHREWAKKDPETGYTLQTKPTGHTPAKIASLTNSGVKHFIL